MYRERIEKLKTNTPAESHLKKVLIDYNQFQNNPQTNALKTQLNALSNWQCQRLQTTHKDLYESPNYQQGLNFLFSDLYAAQDFSSRDRDLERIAPKLIKLMPQKVIGTVALLIELNLETQALDRALGLALLNHSGPQKIDQASYCAAYRSCNNLDDRLKQLELIEQAGRMLNQYARNNMIHFSLKLSKAPAEMAGLNALHNFIFRGFNAFHTMQDIPLLMDTLLQRERKVLHNIFQGESSPFYIQTHPGNLNERNH